MIFHTKDGGRIFYQKVGNGLPVVLLHPVGLNTDFWQAQEKALSKNYTVISIDFRGFGKSDRPNRPFKLKNLAEDVSSLCQSLGLTSFVFCGQSMGGMVAQIIALEWPSLVSGLVLASTTSHIDQEVLYKRASIVEQGGMEAEVDETLARWFTSETLRRKQPLVEKIKNHILENDPQVHAWTWRAIGDFNVLDQIHAIRVPCVVVVGDRDPSTPPSQSKEISQKIKGSRYIEIADAAHMAFLEHPDLFTKIIEEFLDSIVYKGGDGGNKYNE